VALSLSALSSRAKKIRLIGMDIDGVLTDGGVTVLNSGEEVKSWHVRDRFGFVLARESGFPFRFAWISGRRSRSVTRAAKELKVDALALGERDKAGAYADIKKKLGAKDDETAFIGDDLMDLPVLRRVGLSCCPRDASEEIRRRVHYVTRVPGGRGVFREVMELILKSRGLWKGLVERYDE
jgi:3-deoxy-D-manno-octulosonate 8-phosphate phosphatase (KDO 8-P phosphatase)